MTSREKHPVAKVALVGHPNVGKTTLFNQLTGERRKVGNHPGVTVEKVSAMFFTPHGHRMELVDLPGCYSLSPRSLDEQVTRDVLFGDQGRDVRPDLVICVVDASSMERHLGLVLEVIDMGLPVIVAINQLDRAEAKGVRLDRQVLADVLRVPVILCQGTTGQGLIQLKQAMRFPIPPAAERSWRGPGVLESQLSDLTRALEKAGMKNPDIHALHLLASAEYRIERQEFLKREWQVIARDAAAACIKGGVTPEERIAAERRRIITRACRAGVSEVNSEQESLSDKIDTVALHPIGGWAVFGSLMVVVFWAIFYLAKYPMGLIERVVESLGNLVGTLLPAGDLNNLLVNGIIGGVGSVVVFVPQIALLFLFIGILEGSGYMARAAFMMDKIMGRVGLTGKSFLPLLSGYACAIPGVMGTRTINSAKERLLTILILPWTSCSARLPVYTLLVPLLVAGWFQQGLVFFVVYLAGTVTALLAAWVLGKSIGRSEVPPQFMLEFPPYRVPDLMYVVRQVWDRVLAFLKKAGTVILGLSILLWALSAFPKAPEGGDKAQQEYSLMGRLGEVIEPVVAPLGWDGRLGTAMLTSFAAREVFVSTLAVSYSVDIDAEEGEAALRGRLRKAKAKDGSPAYTVPVVLSLLVFFIYALQCLPTTAVVARETKSWKWAVGQLAGMSIFAYLAAWVVYRIALMMS
jgi:ferrous iron transport protein B